MKILLVNDYGTPTAGAEILTIALRDQLKQRGHDARLFASSAAPKKVKNMADHKCFGTVSSLRTLLQSANPSAFWQFRKVMAEFQPDVVHVNIFLTQLSPLILSSLKETPSLYHAHWYRSICPVGTKLLPSGDNCNVSLGIACRHNHCLPRRDWLPLMMQMNLLRRWRGVFDKVIAVSEAVKRRLVAEGIEPVNVIWNGIPIQPQRPPLGDTPLVGFAGRLVQEKGTDVLIKAFAKVVRRLPTAQLILIGDGPERERLSALIGELAIASSVSLCGYLSHDKAERKLAAAWVQAIPSTWGDPFPTVALEAMMRGTAVVASNTGGLPESVQDGETGLIVPKNNDDTLADALLRLLMNRELSEKMGHAGHAFALKHFSQEIWVEKYIQTYKCLCLQGKRSDKR